VTSAPSDKALQPILAKIKVRRLELRTRPIDSSWQLDAAVSPAPFLQTRSALAAMKFTSGANGIEIVAPDTADAIRKADINQAPQDFFFDNTERSNHGIEYGVQAKELQDVRDWVTHTNCNGASIRLGPETPEQREDEALLEYYVHTYILIEHSTSEPADAAIAVERPNGWYWIYDQDKRSLQNFALLTHVLTVQAVAPSNPPLQPTLSLGR
jgi:hypothetical protein